MTPLLPRLLGAHDGDPTGPLMIVVGSLHGNEPSGVEAAQRVLTRLAQNDIPFRGRFVAFVGNRAALALGERYVESDLNRAWNGAAVRRIANTPEERERAELQAVLVAELDAGPEDRDITLLDLHSTSADGSPFAILADTLRNRRIAMELPIPTILGLEENIDGTLLEWFCERGHVAVCLEGGRHLDAVTVDHHEASIWISLVTAGLVLASDAPDLEAHRHRLKAAATGAPRVVEITHRYGIEPGKKFEMNEGFLNFVPVDEETFLARSGPELETEVRPPFGGLLLMPRYQEKGDDGYFLAARVRPMWLSVSAFLRRIRVGSLLPLLPGVRRVGTSGRSLDVNRRVARFLSTEIFHLFGFRRRRVMGDVVRFTRRVERA